MTAVTRITELGFLRRRRRNRADVSAFSSLIETPAVIAFKMPANGRLRVLLKGIGGSPETVVTFGSRAIEPSVAQWQDGTAIVFDWVEKGKLVTPTAFGDIYVDTGLGVWKRIAIG